MRLYYGWYIVAIGLAALTLTIGSVFTSFGLFVRPVSEEFNLSRANMNTALIVLNSGMALAAPFVGRMLDRYPIQRVMAGSAILLGASFVVLGLSHNVWLSTGVLALPLAIATLGTGTLTSRTMVARWFTVQRGRAMAILAIGISMGGILVVPVVGFLLESMAWRQTLIVMGCAIAAIILLLAPFVRDKPGLDDVETKRSEGSHQDQPLAAPAESRGSMTPLKAPQLLRMSQFWSIGLSTAVTLGVLQTFTITVVPLAQQGGLTTTQAASLMSIVAAAAITGKLLLAWVADRLNRVILLACLFGLLALANGTLLFGKGYFLLALCCAFVGLCSGVVAPTFYALMADRFGPASFGTASGLAEPLVMIGSAVCARFGGEVFDRTGSYDLMFTTFVGVLLVASTLMLATRLFANPLLVSDASTRA